MANVNMQELREQILSIVKKEGPILPAQISQKVVSNVLFTSAILSDLVRQNQVQISKAKIGNSPVYYVKGQEHKLSILYKHLGERPRKIYDLLKEKKILRDKDLEPWQRVAVREIKDFASVLNVNYNNQREIFWRWYLMPDGEAKQVIISLLKGENSQPETKDKPQEKKNEEKLLKKDIKERKEQENKLEKINELEKEKTKSEHQKNLKEDKKPEISEFYGLVNTYFTENRVRVIEEKVLRKNTDYEFLVEIPSALGNLKYFVKAKNKKKINDSELNMAYTLGEKQKLPTLILSTGELTRKAERYMESELKGLIFKKLKE